MALEQSIFLAPTDSTSDSAASLEIFQPISTMPFNLTPSSSAPNLITPTSLFTTTTGSPLPSVSSLQFSSTTSDARTNTSGLEQDSLPTTSNQALDVDPQILEALRSKDRIYVLKLGELMEGLINDGRENITLNPTTSYQRLLVHRCSAYYKLTPESDPASKGIIVISTIESRIPPRKLCDLVPAEATTQPAFKIMRRSLQERRPNKSQSQAGSVTGEDADLSDIEPSESGSLGGRSNATGGSNKKRMTIEEREAAYNEARSRIFLGFEEKEKDKDKDMSASSSSLSLVSLSASASGRGGSSSAGDLDDSASSPATESEWSGPSGVHSRDKKDARHMNSSSSSRSLRPSAPAFSSNGSSRNSRAPSPSFTYATIYEPPPGPTYDPSQHPVHPGYHAQHYLYPYSPHGQPQNPYLPPYPYYPPYGPYPPPPPPQQSASDPSTPASVEMYPPPPHVGYTQAYGWPHLHQPPLQSPPQMPQHHSQLSSQPPHHPSHAAIPSPPVHNQQYQPYVPPTQQYAYHVPGYYTPPPGQQHMEPGPPHANPQPMYDVPRSMNGVVMHQINNYGTHTMNRNGGINTSNSNTSTRNGVVNGGKARTPAPTQARSAWSYGPGVGMGGYVTSSGPVGGEAVGPRLSSTRRQSSNSSSANSRSSNCDDVSSTASSSTTSSSSRRTYTSTTSSQHPLPPRPDWAVGLKPQPTLHSTQVRHHDQSNPRTMSPISAPRHLNGGPQHPSAPGRQSASQPLYTTLQSSTDFPPLTTLPAAPEKRTPVIAGAWGNPPTRAIRLPSPGHLNPPTNALVQHPNNAAGNRNAPEMRLEEPDRGFERPPPKSAELYNPKVLRRPTSSKVSGEKEKEQVGGEVIANAILVEQVEDMSLEDQPVGSTSVPTPCTDSVSVMAT